MRVRLIVITALLFLSACAPPFSRSVLDQVDRTITFRDLRSDPERYKGKLVMLAGVIVEVRNAREGTLIEVLQRPAGRRGQPLETDSTEGRFIISTDQFLDAAVYHQGRLITVVGQAAGLKIQPLGEIEYRYPVITAKELHLWEPYAGPRFSIGVGIYHGY